MFIRCIAAVLALSVLALDAPAAIATKPATGLCIFQGISDGFGCTPFELGSFDARGTLIQDAPARKRPHSGLLKTSQAFKTSELWSARPQSWTSVAWGRFCREPRAGGTEVLEMQSHDANQMALRVHGSDPVDLEYEHYRLLQRAKDAVRAHLEHYFDELYYGAVAVEASRIARVRASLLNGDTPWSVSSGTAKEFETYILPATETLVFRSKNVSFVLSAYGDGMRLWTINKLRSRAKGVRVLGVFSGAHVLDSQGEALGYGAVPLQLLFVRPGGESLLRGTASANAAIHADSLLSTFRRSAAWVRHHMSLVSELSIMTLANPGEASFATNLFLSVLMLL